MCRICPGAITWAEILHKPPNTCSVPSTAASSLGASTPFCKGSTTVCPPTIGFSSCRSFGYLPGLHAHQHAVHYSHCSWIIRRLGWLDVKIALGAIYPQAGLLDRLQVLAARDEDHLFPRLGELPAEVTAHASCPEYSNAHCISSCLRMPSIISRNPRLTLFLARISSELTRLANRLKIE